MDSSSTDQSGYEAPRDDGKPAPLIPESIRRNLGPLPLLRGESADEYWELLGLLSAEQQPKSFVEWLLLKEEVDTIWEERRLGRCSRSLIDTTVPTTAHRILALSEKPALSEAQERRGVAHVVQGALAGDPADRRSVEKTLASMGLTFDALTATALADKLDAIERIERLIHVRRRQRRDIAQDVERLRFAMAQARNRAATLDNITDLDPDQVTG